MPASVSPLPPEECAQCGETLPRTAHACPNCGADERTGWRETSIYDGLDLPEDAEDENEFSATRTRHARNNTGLRWYWLVTLITLLIVMLLGTLGLLP
jgi:predicted nucleic acid-binding Zn ribbon protein